MTAAELFSRLQWFAFAYFLGLNFGYLLLLCWSLPSLRQLMQLHGLGSLPQFYSGLEPPISVLLPVGGSGCEQPVATIAATVRRLLQLIYSEHEVIVIVESAGADDDTAEQLIAEFSLVPLTPDYACLVTTRPLRAVYRSTIHANLRLIDKERGDAADALNAGINAATFPFFCAVECGLLWRHDCLHRLVQPFLEEPATVASISAIGLADGSEVKDGFLMRVGLPRTPLALLQLVEHVRAHLLSRLGWTPFNAVLLTADAWCLWSRQAVIEAGGYHATTEPAMELVARLHRHRRAQRKNYRIAFLAEPVCWRHAAASLPAILRQRARWQRGLTQSLLTNRGLLNTSSATLGMVTVPFALVFEMLAPVGELGAYAIMAVGYTLHAIPQESAALFLLVALGLSALVSVTAVLLEGIALHLYRTPRHIAVLLLTAVVEQLGFRQLTTLGRLYGLLGGGGD